MKILYWSPYIGHVGTIKAVVNSAAALKKYGNHDVRLIKNHTEWEGYEERIAGAGIELVDFGLKRWFPKLNQIKWMGSRLYMVTVALFGFFQLIFYMRRDRPDVLVTNLIAIPAILAAQFFYPRPRVVASVQGYPKFLGIQSKSNYPLWMKIEDAIRKQLWNIIYKRADLIVCMTKMTKDKLISQTSLPAERITVINNPIVDDEIFIRANEAVEDPWFFEGCHKRVVAVGRLTKQKDFLTLIQAVSAAAQHVELRLAIIGEGEERLQLEKEIKGRGLSNQIKLYGFLENPYPYIKKSDLFVLTSLWEDPGHAILEAAALNVPIVSTDCPSGPARLLAQGNGGELCPIGDVGCLSAKIAICLNSPKQEEKLKIAYSNAYQFSLQAHFEVFRKYLESWQGLSML